MKRLLAQIVGLLYENQCSICNETCSNSIVCKFCENEFVIRGDNYIKHLDKVKSYVWGMYEGKLRQGIINLKNGNKKLAPYFGKKIAELWEKFPEDIKFGNSLVIPIPSHKKRIKERGFCQTSLIANEFAKTLSLGILNESIVRRKETRFMNTLQSVEERKNNIKDAFEINDRNSIYKCVENIFIVDDIVTSGSTISELASTISTYCPNVNLIGVAVASGDKY